VAEAVAGATDLGGGAPSAALQVGGFFREGHGGHEVGRRVGVGNRLHGERLRGADLLDTGLRDQRHLDSVVARRRQRALR